jgi:Zn-dependent protease/CBS domain-containing protein
MRWSISIGRVFGITMRLHVTFLLLLGMIAYTGFAEAGLHGAGWALAWACSIFACIGLHELGHSVVAQQLGVEVKSITLLPIGGVAALKNIPENPWHEIAITVAGPLVNAVIAVVLLPFTGLPIVLFLHGIPGDLPQLLRALVGTNLWLLLFNCIPAFPMDGGRLLRATLALVLPYQRATTIAATVGQGLAILFVLVGLTHQSLWLLIVIGAFIFMAAEGEEKMVRMRSVLREIDVEDVMSREFATLLPLDTVARGLQYVYQTGQDGFPVVDNERVIGLATRQAIVEAMNASGSEVPIAEVMDTEVPVISPRASVSQVYEKMLGEGHATFPVVDGGRLVGLLSADNISRYLLVQSSIKSSRRRQRERRAGVARTPAPPPVTANAPPVAVPPPRGGSRPPTDQA